MIRAVSPSLYRDLVPALLLGAAWLCALFFRGTDTIWFAPALVLVMATLCLSFFSWWHSGRPLAIPFSASSSVLLAFWLYLLLAASQSEVPFVASLFTLVIGVLPLTFFALVMAPDPARATRGAAAVFLAGSGILALWALVQYFLLYDRFGPRIHHPFLDPNNLSVVFNMGFIASLGFFMSARNKRQTILAAAPMVLFFMALLSTQSRGALIALGVAAVPFFWALPGRLPQKSLRALMAAGIVAATTALVQASTPLTGARSLAGLTQIAGNTVSDRILQWKSTLAMIMDHPFMGPGLGTFFYYYPSYRDRSDLSDGFFCHMDPLQIAAETGILSAVLFYALGIGIVVRTLSALRVAQDKTQQAVIVTTFSAALAVVLHSHIYFHLYMMALLLPLAVILALWYVTTEQVLAKPRIEKNLSPRARHLLMGIALVLALVPLQWTLRSAAGILYVNHAVKLMSGSRLEEADRAMTRAESVAPRSYFHAAQYRARLSIAVLQAQAGSLGAADKQTLYNQGMAALDRAEKWNARFPSMGTERAALLVFGQQNGLAQDGYARAEESLKQALIQNPMNFQARYALSDIYRRQGELQKALSVMKEGLKWTRPKGQPDVSYVVAVALLYKQAGDEETYQRLINEAGARARIYGLTAPR